MDWNDRFALPACGVTDRDRAHIVMALTMRVCSAALLLPLIALVLSVRLLDTWTATAIALLHEHESTTLDFKRDQYPLTNDEEKSELLKDLLAFANTPRATDAHIIIGAHEQPNPPALITGVTHHLRDHELQQLLNKKTNRPVRFAYGTLAIDGTSVGIITINASQAPPHFLTKDYGRLTKGAVYIRHGSSTSIATPDEYLSLRTQPVRANTITPLRVSIMLRSTPTKSNFPFQRFGP